MIRDDVRLLSARKNAMIHLWTEDRGLVILAVAYFFLSGWTFWTACLGYLFLLSYRVGIWCSPDEIALVLSVKMRPSR